MRSWWSMPAAIAALIAGPVAVSWAQEPQRGLDGYWQSVDDARVVAQIQAAEGGGLQGAVHFPDGEILSFSGEAAGQGFEALARTRSEEVEVTGELRGEELVLRLAESSGPRELRFVRYDADTAPGAGAGHQPKSGQEQPGQEGQGESAENPLAGPAQPGSADTAFVGSWSSGQVQLTLDPAAGEGQAQRGTLTVSGQPYPVELSPASGAQGVLEGTFEANGQRFPLRLALEGEELVLTSGDATRRLQRGEAAPELAWLEGTYRGPIQRYFPAAGWLSLEMPASWRPLTDSGSMILIEPAPLEAVAAGPTRPGAAQQPTGQQPTTGQQQAGQQQPNDQQAAIRTLEDAYVVVHYGELPAGTEAGQLDRMLEDRAREELARWNVRVTRADGAEPIQVRRGNGAAGTWEGVRAGQQGDVPVQAWIGGFQDGTRYVTVVGVARADQAASYLPGFKRLLAGAEIIAPAGK